MPTFGSSRPAIRGRVMTRLPATFTAEGGLAVSKTNGVWTLTPDFSQLSEVLAPTVMDPTSKQLWIYDPITGAYNVLDLAGLGDALYKLTSTSSLAVGTGSKVFTTQSGKDIGIGSFVVATSDADPTNYMVGQVAAYSDTTLTITVPSGGTGGSGTYADWTLRVSGPPGTTGATGPTGPMGSGTISGLTSSTNGGIVIYSGTSGQLVTSSTITGVLKASAGVLQTATIGTDYVSPSVTSSMSVGFTAGSYNAGTLTTGTLTLSMTLGNHQHYTNGGAHTLAPPTAVGTMIVECTNASAGALTTSGFTVVSGQTYSSTGTKKHIFYITRTLSYSELNIRYVTGT